MSRHIRNLLRITGSKFENELAERAPHHRENDLKKSSKGPCFS